MIVKSRTTRENLLNLIEEEKREIAEQDAKMKADGFPYKISWWDHTTGGDDIHRETYTAIDPTNNLKIPENELRAYLKENPKSEMGRLLLKVKRESLGDYRVIIL